MSAPPVRPPVVPRVVLDTNVVLSALVFAGGATARLRQAWHAGRLLPLLGTASAQELMRVLAYPKFRLDAQQQQELLADDLPWAEVVAMPERPPRVPACRDRHDLPLLHLAVAGRADALVSGDGDLLALATPGTRPLLHFAVLTVQALLDSLPPACP